MGSSIVRQAVEGERTRHKWGKLRYHGSFTVTEGIIITLRRQCNGSFNRFPRILVSRWRLGTWRSRVRSLDGSAPRLALSIKVGFVGVRSPNDSLLTSPSLDGSHAEHRFHMLRHWM